MLINLRNAMMAGKRLPYDAELEYLESTGTQWIDTGYVPTADDSFYCRVKQNIIQDQAFWGLAGVAYLFWNGVATNNSTFGGHPAIGNGRVNDVNPLGDTNWHEILCQPSGILVDGIQITMQVTAQAQSPLNTVALFARAVNSAGGGVAKNGQGRISAFKVERNGVLVRDFIPVRRGTVGYLYDRVSKRLFGNAGTGDFVLGPDVVPVEYIESHGAEWIDTGISTGTDVSTMPTITGRYQFNPTGQAVYDGIFGHFYGSRAYTISKFSSTTNQVSYKVGNASGYYRTTGLNDWYDFEFNPSQNIFTENGSPIVVGRNYLNVDGHIYLFANYDDQNSRPYSAECKLGKVTIATYQGTFVRSFRPVRVGSGSTWEGAMMDVLTRRIYRNAGTGAFTYGNDLRYPIPAE